MGGWKFKMRNVGKAIFDRVFDKFGLTGSPFSFKLRGDINLVSDVDDVSM